MSSKRCQKRFRGLSGHTRPTRRRVIAVHFGAGALGRGLVVPLLSSAGYRVTLVDADARLITELKRDGGYALLEARDDGLSQRRFVPIQAALPVEASSEVRDAIDQADVVTTAVRVENLPKLARWVRTRATDGGATLTVVACENAYRASRLLAQHAGPSAGIVFRDAIVDRICQSDWPASTLVRAEGYEEWSIEATTADKIPSSAERIEDFDAYFDRKRYLVNTTADALAFLGNRDGHQYLHEAAADGDLLAFCKPAFAELRSLLHTEHAWPRSELATYHARALERLARPELAREIRTVARDGVRKLDAGERFAAPALALMKAGSAPVGMARVIAAIAASLGTSIDDLRARWGGHPYGAQLAELVERSDV